MNPAANPYNPGAGYPPPELVGRDPLISQVRIALGRRIDRRHGKHFFLIGLRGVGKTVLLKHVRSIARDMGYEEAFGEAASLGPSRRKDLIDKGMIYSPAHGELAFSVPLFDKYLNRIL